MDSRFVIDNSVVMTWCFQDEVNSYADAVLESLAKTSAVVPPIWPSEVVNILLVAERNGKLHEAESVRFMTLLGQLPILVDRSWPEKLMKDLLAIGQRHNLTSYDAAYLELAMRQGLPIATLDRKLLEAAKEIDLPILDVL